MEPRKRLGKGIEDISHFFLSSRSSLESNSAESESGYRAVAGGGIHRVIAVLSRTPHLSTLFWTSQLALALAQHGKKVLVIDIGTPRGDQEAVLGPLVIHPSLGDLLNQPHKTPSVQGPGGVRFLAFQLQLEELRQYQSEEGEILFQILLKEEQQANILLVNLSSDPAQEDLEVYLRSLYEAVMVVSPQDLLGAYRILKTLFHIQPGLRVGLLEQIGPKEPYRGGVQRLVLACRDFLKTSPLVLGGIQSEATAFQAPVQDQRISISEAMVEIGKRILQGLDGRESRDLFFDQVQSQLRKPATE